MAEEVVGQAQFRASLAEVSAVLLDIDGYPAWNPGILAVTVDAHDSDGRVLSASFQIDIKLTQLRYTLTYTYGENRVAWRLIDGDLLSQFDGEYQLSEEAGITTVAYAITVDVSMALPRVMKRRAAETLLAQTLTGLSTRCEPV